MTRDLAAPPRLRAPAGAIEAVRRSILVDNPRRLYGFPAISAA